MEASAPPAASVAEAQHGHNRGERSTRGGGDCDRPKRRRAGPGAAHTTMAAASAHTMQANTSGGRLSGGQVAPDRQLISIPGFSTACGDVCTAANTLGWCVGVSRGLLCTAEHPRARQPRRDVSVCLLFLVNSTSTPSTSTCSASSASRCAQVPTDHRHAHVGTPPECQTRPSWPHRPQRPTAAHSTAASTCQPHPTPAPSTCHTPLLRCNGCSRTAATYLRATRRAVGEHTHPHTCAIGHARSSTPHAPTTPQPETARYLEERGAEARHGPHGRVARHALRRRAAPDQRVQQAAQRRTRLRLRRRRAARGAAAALLRRRAQRAATAVHVHRARMRGRGRGAAAHRSARSPLLLRRGPARVRWRHGGQPRHLPRVVRE
jgi:hypothetical protein